MSRQTAIKHQQISLFDPLFSVASSAVAPLFEGPVHTRKDTAAHDHDVFSEITLSGQTQQCLQLIAPILRDLSEDQNDRWLTLISPPEQITAQWLRDAGLNRERILVLHPSGMQSSQELACDALRLGCSHTVISWFNPLPHAAKNSLVTAARAGTTQILNIRQPFTV